ncbi:MAG: patatin-like phospholipase family protein [Deltaproteobacteria bacterium]|nr:patatin-like phospholipase family protein [Deltaproteobacteria bacterium]
MPDNASKKKLALVLSGGGARGAFEAGIIHYIRTKLPPQIAHKRPFDIYCGSSVGAINTCFMAASNHNLEYQGRRIFAIWNELEQAKIYRRGVGMLTRFVSRTIAGTMRHFFGLQPKAETIQKFKQYHFVGLLDTSPLPFFLKEIIAWKQISLNVQRGSPLAVSVTATNVHSGKMELFVEKHPSVNYTGRHRAHFVTVEARHAMASAALPLLFPTVRVGSNFYCDGGLRLNTPLSPAVQLGADKILVVGLHHKTERAEQAVDEPFLEHPLPPTMGEILGKVLNSIFLDKLDYDIEQMDRINRVIQWGSEVYGADFLERVNGYLKEKGLKGDIAARGLKRLQVMTIFPSSDIRTIFRECVDDPKFLKKNLTTFERTLMKVLDVDIRHGEDFLSFILFIPFYMKRLLELGFEDARKNHDRLVEFFESN